MIQGVNRNFLVLFIRVRFLSSPCNYSTAGSVSNNRLLRTDFQGFLIFGKKGHARRDNAAVSVQHRGLIEVRIGDIKRRDIAAYFARPVVQELARSTAEKQGQMLNMIFRMALDDELIDKNPALDYRVYLPKRATKRKPLRIDETADIIENLIKLEDDDRLFLSILLFTGCRRGEALGMKAGDIDRANRLVSIQRAVTFVNGRPVVGLPKTKESVRTIPIVEGFPYDLIQDMGPDDFLLGGQSPWTERKYACSMKRIKKTIDLHGATAHIFRHSFCTDAISANIDIKTVQGLLGHATPYTTMNVYAHVQQEKLLSIGDRLAGIYSRDV